jgi:hypothetical protein
MPEVDDMAGERDLVVAAGLARFLAPRHMNAGL